VSSQQHPPVRLRSGEVQEVADRVFAYVQPDGSWWINNAGFIVSRDSVIGIDSCSTESRTRTYLDRLAAIARLPVRMLVNTHHHGDHTFGNSLFTDAVVIGHENCRTELLAAGTPSNQGWWDPVDWGDIRLSPPTLTFTDQVRLWSDELPVDVTYVGRAAHTTNDCLVWLPDQRVLFCGDLMFNGGTPFLLMGSVVGAVDVLRHTVSGINADTIVPGHGSPCGAELIDTTLAYLEFVLRTAKQGVDAGLSPLEAARSCDLGEYAGWLDSERIVGNLHRAYLDIDPTRSPVDVSAAFADMIAYNGGRPLPCHA
jgi:cyclase